VIDANSLFLLLKWHFFCLKVVHYEAMEKSQKYIHRVEITRYAQSKGGSRVDITWQGDELTLYKDAESQNCTFNDEDFAEREKWEPLVDDMIIKLKNGY
jgi:hypothetical protein